MAVETIASPEEESPEEVETMDEPACPPSPASTVGVPRRRSTLSLLEQPSTIRLCSPTPSITATKDELPFFGKSTVKEAWELVKTMRLGASRAASRMPCHLFSAPIPFSKSLLDIHSSCPTRCDGATMTPTFELTTCEVATVVCCAINLSCRETQRRGSSSPDSHVPACCMINTRSGVDGMSLSGLEPRRSLEHGLRCGCADLGMDLWSLRCRRVYVKSCVLLIVN